MLLFTFSDAVTSISRFFPLLLIFFLQKKPEIELGMYLCAVVHPRRYFSNLHFCLRMCNDAFLDEIFNLSERESRYVFHSGKRKNSCDEKLPLQVWDGHFVLYYFFQIAFSLIFSYFYQICSLFYEYITSEKNTQIKFFESLVHYSVERRYLFLKLDFSTSFRKFVGTYPLDTLAYKAFFFDF